MPPQIDEPREFRMQSDYRRCAIYVLVGAVICSATLAVANHLIVHRPWAPVAGMACFFIAGSVALAAVVFRWRLRVDEHGISRRRLIGWHLWPWEAFENGRILAHFGGCVWAEEPWWRRTLAFLVDEDARALLNGICREFQPPLPPLPEEIEVRCSFRKRVRFSADGIRYYEGDYEFPYFWTDVQQMRIKVSEHGWPGFVRLTIQLTQHEVDLLTQERQPRWKGPDADTVRRFVQQHIPAERTLVIARHGPPKSLEEVDRRIEEIESRIQGLRNGMLLIAMLFLGLLATVLVSAREWNVWQLPAGCCYGLVFLLIWWAIKAESGRKIADLQQLQQCRDALSSNGQSSGP